MAQAYNARCLVLKKTKLGETDLIVTLLTRQGGQIRAVAKGARRPGSKFGARMEPYSEVDLLLHPGKNLETITECRCVTTNAACREDLLKTSSCSPICELLEKSSRDDELGEKVYDLTIAALRSIGSGDADQAPMLCIAHLLKTFAFMGIRPALRECALCGNPVTGYETFDLYSGGALCEECAQTVASGFMDPALVSWIDLLLYSTFGELEEVTNCPSFELAEVCESWMREHLDLSLRSIQLLKQLCR